MEEKIKAIIFDYDGTLVKRDENFLYKILPKIKNKDKIIKLIHIKLKRTNDIRKSIEDAFKEMNKKLDKKELNKYVEKYVSLFKKGKIDNKTKKIIKDLHKKFKIFIVTNGNKKYKKEELKKNKILQFFDDIITPEDCGYRKPDKRIFEFILKKHSLKPSEVVCVGNSLKEDIIPAKKLGMKTIWIYEFKPDVIIKNLFELNEEVIQKL